MICAIFARYVEGSILFTSSPSPLYISMRRELVNHRITMIVYVPVKHETEEQTLPSLFVISSALPPPALAAV